MQLNAWGECIASLPCDWLKLFDSRRLTFYPSTCFINNHLIASHAASIWKMQCNGKTKMSKISFLIYRNARSCVCVREWWNKRANYTWNI